ncbi:alpha-amylase family glycosyl hydrolase [Azospirillum halopraeferens]|uniref:alpha-amylase family glycosyl hydrolase n=1 Tax=Azospirillum halopraeferens TaxID=34010 RepID=UPI00041ED1A1|nr:alpha-amylase family glycosyl hydrolase [Azospirillum halopraeferens]
MANTASWLRGAALYQIYPLSFLDADGDGWGDLEGVLSGLDHIASLGVDGVWICPFYPSPLADFGYDVADHRDVDRRMGNLATFDRVLEAAHARGLKVIIDLVLGHTSDEHPWFRASRRSRSGPLADRYVWADPAPDGMPPNNWLSVFGGSAWTWEPRRRQYYLHHFLSSQPSLNLHDAACLQEMLDTAAFWLERGVDGFRIDAVDFFAHDPELRPNPALGWQGEPPVKLFGLQRHVHDMMHPTIRTVLERLRAVADRYEGRVLLGELSSQPGGSQRIARYTAPGGLHAAYTLGVAKQPFGARPFAEALTGVDDPGAICWSLSNHDVERAISRWLPDGADPERFNALLAALFCALPGTVCLYQGEELALPRATLAQAELRDPFGKTYWPEFQGRDGSRTPLPWRADADHCGFTAASAPWLPVPAAHRAHAIDRLDARPDGPLAVWRTTLALRRAHPALRHGAVAAVEAEGAVLAFERVAEGERVLAVINTADAPAELSLKHRPRATPLDLPRPAGAPPAEVTADGRTLVLPPLTAWLGLA